jgi:hypothetical protein
MRKTVLLVLLFAAWPGQASDWQGRYMVRGGIDCTMYLDQFTFDRENRLAADTVTAPFAQTHGWIKGYLTAYNAWARNGMVDIQGGMGAGAVERWLAEACGSTDVVDLADALRAFVEWRREGQPQAGLSAPPLL